MRTPRPIPAPVTRPEPHRAPLRAGVGPSHHHRPWMGETLLHWTASCGDADGARALLPLGADPNAPDDAGNTPLHRAAEWGITARGRWLVVMLLAAGADPSRKNNAATTPGCVLLAAGADPDQFPVDFPD